VASGPLGAEGARPRRVPWARPALGAPSPRGGARGGGARAGLLLATTGASRAAVAAPLGFLIGLSLGALGGGGSILAVPALVYGAGEGAKAATTASLLVVGTTALAGMVGHLRAGRVRVAEGFGFGLVGVGGSFAGSLLNRDVPGSVLLLAFSGLVLLAAWRMHRRHEETPCAAKQRARRPQDADGAAPPGDAPAPPRGARWHGRAAAGGRVLLAGSVVGFLTGFFGVGGGFVIVPALVLALRFDMPSAVGTSLLVIAVSSAEGLAFRLGREGVDWLVVLPFTAAGVIGALLGDVVAGRVSPARLTRWFVWLLVAVAAYTATRSALAL